jgi:hypothetical protein
MKLIGYSAAIAAALALSACGGNNQTANGAGNAAAAEASNLENASDTIDAVADNATGNAADALSNQASAVENAADNMAAAHSNTTSNAH